ncbi:PfkB family carbohydrate kinase [Cryobacterium sp. TMT3-29-2]
MNADEPHPVNAVAADVRDTNGAGDAFLAGYLDATLTGASTDAALASAASQAAVALGLKHLHPPLEALLSHLGPGLPFQQVNVPNL